jgi:Holliday junction resolvasome RuvABC ATP-dependent DNA helicase subunit
MKSHKLIEIDNVVIANRVLKNLLNRTRTESVGLGLFYGKAGLGKTRWAWKTALENQYIYMRLECNATVKDFMTSLLSKLLYNTNQNSKVKGTHNDIYNQILDILQNDQNIVIFCDEIDYGFQKKKILATIRDLIDQSLATFVLIGMEQAKEKLKAMHSHYFDRCGSFMLFKELKYEDAEKLLKEVCEVAVDLETIKYVFSRCNGTMRILNKYIESLERIGKRLKKNELTFEEIKDIITKVE